MCVDFQVSDGKADKAMGIFYKALQNVPWAKVRSNDMSQQQLNVFCFFWNCSLENVFLSLSLVWMIVCDCKFAFLQIFTVCMVNMVDQGVYMDGMQLFPERMQEFVDLMTEKELRLRLPVEELDILLEE